MTRHSDLDSKPLRLTSSKDILLVIPPPFFTAMPHIGVAYLSRYLESQGVQVGVYDLSVKLFNQCSEDLKKFWHVECNNNYFISEIAENILKGCQEEIDQFVDDFLFTKTKVIGFSVNITSIFLANQVAKKIKEKAPEKLIIFGGAGTYFPHPRDLIRPAFADIYILGEGERALLSVVRDFYDKKPITHAPGVFLTKDLGKVQPVPSLEVPNPDDIPFPTFEGFNLQEYNQGDDAKPLPLLLSRGCVRRCSYCIDYIIWPKYRFRSPEHILSEIKYHLANNNTKAFHLNDLSCNGNLDQLSKFCDMILESKCQFDWVSYALVRKDMTPELFQKMKKAGCHTLIFGVESGSDKILKLMHKTYTAQDASQVLRMSHESGIYTNMNIIVGFPGETEDDFNDTVKFLEENKPFIDEVANVNGFSVLPGTEVETHKEKFGVSLDVSREPMLFTDSNGLDRAGRFKRVVKIMEAVEKLELRKGFISKPALNPEVIAFNKARRPPFWRKWIAPSKGTGRSDSLDGK